ncbi:PRC-barrel domain-containing protein [Virgibacillus necropolis]|uniref:PRC-barrel domain-containing protein n=1 Tax=Virgibacillus necropolis TaxID=163877 RepID=UPI00384EE1A5
MLYLTSALKSYNIHATDGEMGKVKDFYFDDHSWAIRYVQVDTHKWLPARNVYLSPSSFTSVDVDEKLVEVDHTKDTIKNSPTIPADAEISKTNEASLTEYYGWNRYWRGANLWGAVDRPFVPKVPVQDEENSAKRNEMDMNENTNYILLNEADTIGIKVHGHDGKLGEITDLIFDDDNWKIDYLVVKFVKVPAERYYLIKSEHITSIEWPEKDLYVDLKAEYLDQQISYETKEDTLASL